MRFSLLLLPLIVLFVSLAYGNSEKNICHIFKKHPNWLKVAKNTDHKWGVPIPIQMAIIKQESHFSAHAKNPKSSAYGYAQVLNQLWRRYQRDEQMHAARSNFQDASNFIGWYAHIVRQELGIRPTNAYALYLAYHDGGNGYLRDLKHRHTFSKKIAQRVEHTAGVYEKQLRQCC